MKTAMLCVLAMIAFAPVAFAQTWCEQSCCEESGGSWDSDFESCDYPGDSYYTCLSDYCSSSTYGTGGTGTTGGSGSFSCCGTGFILAAVGGLAMLRMNRGGS